MVNRRRTTLGGVSTNRRTTMAPSASTGLEKANNPSKPKGRTRKSMAPRMMSSGNANANDNSHTEDKAKTKKTSKSSASNRRKTMSTLPNNNTNHASHLTTRSDPRPMHDKSYFTSCVRKLHSYLESHNYPHPIKFKDLTKPSAKEFHNIATFLLRQIDPTFQKSPLRKFEDEVVMSFKTLGYPFNISKTSLVAAGSPHIWPSLLLAITWLMERLELISSANGAVMGGVTGEAGVSVQASDGGLEQEDEFNHVQEYQGLDSIGAAGQPFTTPEAMELRTDRAFLLYVEVAYESFLAGDDASYDTLEEELLDYFEKDQMVLEQEIEKVTDENATVVESITHIENEMNDLPERQKHVEDLATDLEKFHDLVQKLIEHKQTLTETVKKRTEEYERISHSIMEKKKNNKDLKDILNSQELSVEDVRRLEEDRLQLEAEIENVLRTRREFESAYLNEDMKLKTKMKALEENVIAYCRQVQELNLSDQLSNINLQKSANYEDDVNLLLGVDVKEDILPTLKGRKDSIIEETAGMKREHFSLMDKQEESEEALSELNDAIEILNGKKRRAQDVQSREKEEHEAALAVRHKEVQLVENKVSSLSDPGSMESTIVKYQRQCSELESLRQKHQDENLAKKKAVLQEVNDVISFCTELKTLQKQELKGLQEYIMGKHLKNVKFSEEEEKLISTF